MLESYTRGARVLLAAGALLDPAGTGQGYSTRQDETRGNQPENRPTS